MVAVMFAAGASAQDWSIGGRVGSGFQAVGQYKYNGKNYIEARFGASWNNPVVSTVITTDNDIYASEGRVMADFTLLHYWRAIEMDWTPRAGRWFFDAGVGVNVPGTGVATVTIISSFNNSSLFIIQNNTMTTHTACPITVTLLFKNSRIHPYPFLQA